MIETTPAMTKAMQAKSEYLLPGVSAQEMSDALTAPKLQDFYREDARTMPALIRKHRGWWFALRVKIRSLF